MKHQFLQPEIMKKIVPILFLVLTLAASAAAQTDSELRFSRVVLVENVAQTVPAGKVWKVESALYNGGAPFCLGAANCGPNTQVRGADGLMTFVVNGLSVHIPSNTYYNSNPTNPSSSTHNSFPFWLPAGSTLQASTNVRYLSVLEFSVVP
jgi:hypothetical protein